MPAFLANKRICIAVYIFDIVCITKVVAFNGCWKNGGYRCQ